MVLRFSPYQGETRRKEVVIDPLDGAFSVSALFAADDQKKQMNRRRSDRRRKRRRSEVEADDQKMKQTNRR